MTVTTEPDHLAHAKEQGQAQFDAIVEMVEALNKARSQYEDGIGDVTDAREEAEQRIHENALSVEVRSGWYIPGSDLDPHTSKDNKPSDYRITLCTGGPAVQIRGELSGYGEPAAARLEVQDWGTPWTEFVPRGPQAVGYDDTLLDYARCFWFGE